MRILFVIDGLFPGGKERRFVELLKHIHRGSLAEVEAVMLSKEIRYPEYATLGVPTHFMVRKRKKDLNVLLDLLRVCRRFRPDIVHTWDSMTSVYAAAIRPTRSFALVNGMITHAPDRVSRQDWVRARLTFPLSAAIVANSQAGLRAYRVPTRKAHCIYNGFDDSRLPRSGSRSEMRHTLGIQTDFAVCMVGEFADRKDFATYIAAAQKILDRRRDVTFLAVGDGPTLPACKALLRPENADRVMFTGWRTDVEDIVHCTDIGVLATFTEGISNSILEYMALGKPVVATDGGGTNEIVGDGLTGYLVPREDATALSDAIVRLLDHPDDAQRMGEAGRCVVRDRFSIGTMVQAYMNLYSGLHPEGMHRALVLG